MTGAGGCQWCGEPIEAGTLEAWATAFADAPFSPSMHKECAIRAIVGGVAHLEGRCSCYHGGDGVSDDDETGLTRREAARRAAQIYLSRLLDSSN